MNITHSTQKLILSILFFASIIGQDCTVLNPNDYGDCSMALGYIWTCSECISISGCDMGENEEYFFETYEECSIICNNNSILGDLNNDSNINIIDIVQLVNLILNDENYLVSGDLNFDGMIDVIDIVSLVNLILSANDSRDTWEIIKEDILTSKCANCHYEGSFYAETSNLILTEDIAYEQLINRVPDNNSALNNGLMLLSEEGGLIGLLLSFLWEKINNSLLKSDVF